MPVEQRLSLSSLRNAIPSPFSLLGSLLSAAAILQWPLVRTPHSNESGCLDSIQGESPFALLLTLHLAPLSSPLPPRSTEPTASRASLSAHIAASAPQGTVHLLLKHQGLMRPIFLLHTSARLLGEKFSHNAHMHSLHPLPSSLPLPPSLPPSLPASLHESVPLSGRKSHCAWSRAEPCEGVAGDRVH